MTNRVLTPFVDPFRHADVCHKPEVADGRSSDRSKRYQFRLPTAEERPYSCLLSVCYGKAGMGVRPPAAADLIEVN
jgi:hypothetical protein